MFVHIVGHHPDMRMLHQHIGDRLQFGTGVGGAGRIRRRAQDDPLGFGRDRLLQCRRLQLEPLLGRADHGHGFAAGERHHFRIAHPVGCGNDDLIAGVNGGHQGIVEYLFAAGADDDLVRLVGQIVLAQKLGRDGLLQFGNAADIGVFGFAGLDCLDGGQLDVRRRVEIRLARAKTDDVASGRFERACFVRHRDGRGRLHTIERSGQKRHHDLLAGIVTHHVPLPIHDSHCWDRRTLKRVRLRRKKLARKLVNFREH